MMRNTKVCLEYVNENYVDENNMAATPSAYEILQLIADTYIYGGAKERKRYFKVVDVSVFANEYHLTSAGELHISDTVEKYSADTDGLTSIAYTYKRSKAKGDLMNNKEYFDFI